MDQRPAQPNTAPAKESVPRPPNLPALLFLIFLAALVLRLTYALSRPVPLTADAAYYLAVAENIYDGRGLVCDYVWNYLTGIPTALPVPSNEYWMPGTSAVICAAFALARSTSPRVAQAPSLLFGALLCVTTAWMGGILFHRRDIALLAGAMAAISFHLVGVALYPDHFMLAGTLVNLSLLALWAAWRDSPRYALVSGALAGLAYFTRSDGAAAALRVAEAIGATYLIARADAPDKIPAIAEIADHPRFQPIARHPAGETRLLVYRILPAAPPGAGTARR